MPTPLFSGELLRSVGFRRHFQIEISISIEKIFQRTLFWGAGEQQCESECWGSRWRCRLHRQGARLKIKRRRESEAVGRGMAAAPMAAHGGGVEKLPYEGDGAFVVEGDMWKVSF